MQLIDQHQQPKHMETQHQQRGNIKSEVFPQRRLLALEDETAIGEPRIKYTNKVRKNGNRLIVPSCMQDPIQERENGNAGQGIRATNQQIHQLLITP
ncbi:hypothetical protein RF679_01420 [Undibacterium cyanobacteriorum]|uniref:Uncharacterized protein n=1 Tax=Undibacterium cyanobacteriorum TaxID=3073561 RepID=A0ABY9RJ49_9BURK|nr:hypothetical protein [Undibacterium sp. 20NA77.5]WMW80956.1 hypothetical protein RF679_01420 [Undibacterium sp. 20NA77.5]